MKILKLIPGIFVMLMFFNPDHISGQWLYSGSNIYNSNSGNVGVGNNVPGSLLYVGKIMTEPTITVRNFGGYGGATYSMIDDASGANWKFKATLNGGFKIRDHANSLDVITIEPNSGANEIYIQSGGKIGFGGVPTINDTKLSLINNNTLSFFLENDNPDYCYGYYGYMPGTTNYNYAFFGDQRGINGAAGAFYAYNASGGSCGVYGRASGNNANSCGVAGHHYYGGAGVGAWSYTGYLFVGYAGDYPGGSLKFYVTNDGAVYADGGYNTYAPVTLPGKEKEYRTLTSLQATESWIEDMGTASLVNGKKVVNIDPVFSQIGDLSQNYMVYLTPVSEEIVYLVVTSKDRDHFTVKGVTLNGKPASCSFDYRIVARDRQMKAQRLEVVNIPEPVDVPREEIK